MIAFTSHFITKLVYLFIDFIYLFKAGKMYLAQLGHNVNQAEDDTKILKLDQMYFK